MTNQKYDYLIVGSGLFGATFAHFAHKQGKKCLVIDKRSHLGGNIYCENIEGINVHKYGAHIFHTSNKKVCISPIQRPHYIPSSYTYQFFEKSYSCIVFRVKDC